MTDFRAKTRRRSRLWAVALALSIAGTPFYKIHAQGVPEPGPASLRPLILQPPSRLDPPTAPVPEAAVPSPPSAASGEKAGAGGEPSIRVGSLDDVQPDSAGTMSEANGGFPSKLWQGTPRAVIDKLLPALPVEADSPAMHQLSRRLLLSAAEVPAGETKSSLFAVRAELLARMGEEGSLAELFELLRHQPRSEPLARIELDARLVNFDMEGVCSSAGSASNVAADAYWQQILVFCQALAKQRDQAALGASLLRERNLSDPTFFELMDDLNGLGEAKLDAMKDPSALNLAMIRAAEVLLPPSLLKSTKPSHLRLIAMSPKLDMKSRLAAAERAEAMGGLSSASLGAMYAKVEFTKEQREKPISAAEAVDGPIGRALLYRTALDQSVPAVRAEALSQVFKLAQRSKVFPTVARTVLPLVAALPVSAELAWFAPEAARALLVAGTTEGVGAWLALARGGALSDMERQKKFFSVLPLARLAGIEEAKTWDPELVAWRKAVADTDSNNEQAILLFALLGGLRDPVTEGFWIGLLQQTGQVPAMLPTAPLWHRLEQASAAGRLGETVALALIVLGNGGTDEANPIAMRVAVEALSRIGEVKAARALAIEAAVAAGL